MQRTSTLKHPMCRHSDTITYHRFRITWCSYGPQLPEAVAITAIACAFLGHWRLACNMLHHLVQYVVAAQDVLEEIALPLLKAPRLVDSSALNFHVAATAMLGLFASSRHPHRLCASHPAAEHPQNRNHQLSAHSHTEIHQAADVQPQQVVQD